MEKPVPPSLPKRKPDYLKVIDYGRDDQRFGFGVVTAHQWEDKSKVREYITHIVFRVGDAKKMMKRFRDASDSEAGMFLEYNGFSDGRTHRVRIAACDDVSITDEQGQTSPQVRFTLRLKQGDYVDFLKRPAKT